MLRLRPQGSEVELTLHPEMAVDASGLVHGGFVFSAANLCAMLAINHPNVVVASADVRFLRPSRTGGVLRFDGQVQSNEGKRHTVTVRARDEENTDVFEGRFICVIPSRHVLEALIPHS